MNESSDAKKSERRQEARRQTEPLRLPMRDERGGTVEEAPAPGEEHAP